MKLLRMGSTGPYVELAALALSRSGYFPAGPTRVFNAALRTAVLRFQNDFGLAVDGIIGPATWAALIPFIQGYRDYTVRPGDTYYSLARRFYTSISAIATANPGIDPENLQIGTRLRVPYGFDVVPVDISYSSELVSLIAGGLLARYPYLTGESIGSSVMGRPLTSLALGTGTELMFNASHHANEWITTPLVLKYLESCLKAYAASGSVGGLRARELFAGVRLYIVPLVDPDGVDLVTGALDEGASYQNARRIAAAYPAIPFPSGWKANIEGTDLNLNYPAGWDRAREIKFAQGYRTPAPRDYVGTAPLSAPESRAMYDFTRARSFQLTISFHSQGEVIYWKYDGYEPPRALEIARLMGEASGYSVELTPPESGYAGYKDWFIQDYDRPGYTVEVGRGVNPLPLSQFGEIYRAGSAIMSTALNAVR